MLENNTLTLSAVLPYNHPTYSGAWMNAIGCAYQNTPVLQVKPILIPFHSFSEHNPLTTEKTNVFTTIGLEFNVTNVRLYRLKYDIVTGYDDPKLPLIQEQVPEIVRDLQQMYESTLFNGIVPEYGFKENSKTKTVSYTGDTTSADAFVAFISSKLETMINNFGRGGNYTLMLPLGWYAGFTNVMGISADEYIENALKNRASRLGATLTLYDSEVCDAPYLIYTPCVMGFFGAMPYLSKTINDDRREESVYRFIMDTPAVVITKQNAVLKITGLTSALNNQNKMGVVLKPHKKTGEPFAHIESFQKAKSSKN